MSKQTSLIKKNLFHYRHTEPSPITTITSVLELSNQLSLSTTIRGYFEYMYSNSTHDKPTLYSTQIIVIGEGPVVTRRSPHKAYYQAFFRVLIDLIVELFGLIIKPRLTAYGLDQSILLKGILKSIL